MSPRSRASAEITELADRLHSTAIHVLRRVRRHDPASGITPARLSALSVVVFAGPMSLGALAKAEQVRPPTMSRTVAALEQAGLVQREANDEDGRGVIVHATKAGQRLLDDARRRRVTSLATELGDLRPREISALKTSLAALARALDLPSRD